MYSLVHICHQQLEYLKTFSGDSRGTVRCYLVFVFVFALPYNIIIRAGGAVAYSGAEGCGFESQASSCKTPPVRPVGYLTLVGEG